VFKVLYRNASLISDRKCHEKDEMHAAGEPADKADVGQLVAVARQRKKADADRIARAMKGAKPQDNFDAIQPLVHDVLDVHRVVLTWRCWEVLDLTGKDHARTMLRHTVRHCANFDHRWAGTWPTFRDTLPKVMENHKLLKRAAGTRKADDAWVEKMAKLVYS